MTIQNDDVLLVNQGGTSKRTKYETIKNQIVSDENLVSDAAGSISNDGVQYARKDGGWDAVVIPPAYGDTDVNSLLNQPTANIGEVLSYGGLDANNDPVYDWIASSSGGSTSLANTNYTYPNGQPRSAQARLEDYVSVADFGGFPTTAQAPNNAASNTIAFQAAIATGKQVFVPKGRYELDGQLTFQETDVFLMGEGERQTELVWLHSGDGIVADITKDRPGPSQKGQFRLENISISNTAATSGTAITVSDTAYDSGGIINTVILENVAFNPTWSKAVEFNKCRQIKVRNLTAFLNPPLSSNTEMPILHLKDSCVDSTFTTMHIGHGNDGDNSTTGMLIDGTVEIGNEGVRISDSTFLHLNIGVHHNGEIPNQNSFEPHLDIGGCHMNCLKHCIKLTNVGQSFIHHNLLYPWSIPTSNDFIVNSVTGQAAVKDSQIIFIGGDRGGEQLIISNNVLNGQGRINTASGNAPLTVTDTGIKWTSNINHLGTSINNNVFTGLDEGIVVDGTNANQISCLNNTFDSAMLGNTQFKAPNGNINDSTLIDGYDASGNATNHVIHAIRSRGSINKSVSLRLQNNNNNFYITQNSNNNAEISFKNDLTFNAGFGTSNVVQNMKFHANGDVEVYHRLLIYNQSKSQRYEIYVDGSGNVVAAQA
jgi:hypothetical protein